MAKEDKKKEEKPAINYKDDFARYELARWAAIAEQSQDKQVYGTLMPALAGFYENFQMGQRTLLQDPFIAGAFLRAATDLKERGKVMDRDFLNALGVHDSIYNNALENVTVRDIIERAEANGYEVPENFKEKVSKYEGMNLKELEDAAKKDKDAKAVYFGVESIESTKMYGRLFGKVFCEGTTSLLERIVESENNKENNIIKLHPRKKYRLAA